MRQNLRRCRTTTPIAGRDWKSGSIRTGDERSKQTPLSVIARAIMWDLVNEAVSEKVSLLCTDQWIGYKRLDKTYPHATVDHAKHQCVVGAGHTQRLKASG